MKSCISVINSGSSSIKFSLFRVEEEELELLYQGQVEGIGTSPAFKAQNGAGETVDEELWENSKAYDHQALLEFLLGWIRKRRLEYGYDLIGVGHRVVHGGEAYTGPVVIDQDVLRILQGFAPLAPLHQTHNLGSIKLIMELDPSIRQVACFDTAFHQTNAKMVQQFGLPRELSEEGIKRYGFHGLSYEYIAKQLRKIKPELAAGRVVVAHLGSGASMCALAGGKSVASSMGFSAMDGLMMGTRPGNLDPGVVLHLIAEKKMGLGELTDLFYRRCGLMGVSGISNDMRVLLDSSDPHAEEAIDLFLYRIKKELGGLAATLDGLDTLVFTAGVGENSAEIRRRVCEDAAWLGLKLDGQANKAKKTIISTTDSKVNALVIPTNEEEMIAFHTRELLLGE